ncbi:MAG: YhbY family RNA-binding protein [Eubacteriaceae bacterium]|jgi:RNA-binding protein|nr:YhbY family RNA-binding protein [Eubacteriaceae bacterium]
MLTSYQRNHLRKLAQTLTSIVYIGKDGVNYEVIVQTKDALKARELIKGKVQQNAPISVQEAAQILSEESKADIVHTMGNTFVLYKRNPQNPKVVIPKRKP